MSKPLVVVHADKELVAQSSAARLVTRIVDAQWSRGNASVVLTGGSSGIGVLAALADSPARATIDWRRVDVWWGDERFVPADDPERNDKQARDALLDRLDLDAARVHPFPASDGPLGDDPEAAARWYADQLAAHPVTGGAPMFDVLMLGVGEEGHVASIFPDSPAATDDGVVCAVYDCPKPPPTRLSLTFPTLARAGEVWFLTTGAGKAQAVARALGGASPTDVPAAGPKGTERTLWLVDADAASELPPERRTLPAR